MPENQTTEIIQEPVEIYLADCTGTIVRAIEAGLPQREIAWDYGQALRSAVAKMDTPDWSAINTAILAKWSMSGLKRIKKLAWKIAEGKA